MPGPGPIGAKLTTNPPWHSPLHRHPRARPGDQSTLDVVKMIPGSSPGMTVQGTRTLILAPMGPGPGTHDFHSLNQGREWPGQQARPGHKLRPEPITTRTRIMDDDPL